MNLSFEEDRFKKLSQIEIWLLNIHKWNYRWKFISQLSFLECFNSGTDNESNQSFRNFENYSQNVRYFTGKKKAWQFPLQIKIQIPATLSNFLGEIRSPPSYPYLFP